MLKLSMIGHIGKDATIREVNGKMVISFSIAHSEDYMKDGFKIEKTTWVRCDLWRDRNNINISNYLKKGTYVYVEGTPRVSAYISREGVTTPSLDCRVTMIQLLSSGRKTENKIAEIPEPNEESQSEINERENESPLAQDDDLPF